MKDFISRIIAKVFGSRRKSENIGSRIMAKLLRRQRTIKLEFEKGKSREVKVTYKDKEYTVYGDMVVVYKDLAWLTAKGFDVFKPTLEEIDKLEGLLSDLIIHESSEGDLRDALRVVKSLRRRFISTEDLVKPEDD